MNLTVVKTVWYLTSQNPAESSKVDLSYGTVPFRPHTCYSIQRQGTAALRAGLTEDMQGCGAAALRRHAVPCGAVRCGAVRRRAALHLDWRARLRAVAAPSACCSASLRQESAAAELCGAVRCCAVDSFLVAVRCSGRCCAVPVLR